MMGRVILATALGIVAFNFLVMAMTAQRWALAAPAVLCGFLAWWLVKDVT